MKSGAPIATQERSKGNLGWFLVNFGALNLVGSSVANRQGDKGHFQTPIPVFGVVLLLGGMNFHFCMMNIFRDCATTKLRCGVFHHTTHQTWKWDTTPKTKTACCPWDMILGPPKKPFFLWLRVITEWNPKRMVRWWSKQPKGPLLLHCRLDGGFFLLLLGQSFLNKRTLPS